MRKHFILLIFIASTILTANAQSGRGVKIGYIDMEYILENVPEYSEANIQLEQKAQKWKQEMETKKNEISKLKESLKTEQVLLTKELIQERQDEIAYLENDLIEYQQKKFGPTGELVVQKAVLAQPIQDQIFTAVQDLADAKKYDFIFDKSSDLTMLFAAKRFDVSDYIIRTLARASKRSQMSKKQIKEEETKAAKEDFEELNPELAARQKALEDKKAAREKLLEERRANYEAKKLELEANRKKAQEEKNLKKNAPASAKTEPETPAKTEIPTEKKSPSATESQNVSAKVEADKKINKSEPTKTEKSTSVNNESAKNTTQPTKPAEKPAAVSTEAAKTTAEEKAAAKEAAAEAHKKALEQRKKEIEERKAKVLATRDSIKKSKAEEQKEKTKN